MKTDLANAVAALLTSESKADLKVGLLFQTNKAVAQRITSAGHRTVVVGDRFGLLYKVYRKARKNPGPMPWIIEARLDALPIRNRSLDALVLLCRVPAESAVKRELHVFRGVLKDAGLLVWPHPLTEDFFAKAAGVLWPFCGGIYKRIKRHELCSIVMQSGFKEIGQIVVPGRLTPWVVTTARVAPRPKI